MAAALLMAVQQACLAAAMVLHLATDHLQDMVLHQATALPAMALQVHQTITEVWAHHHVTAAITTAADVTAGTVPAIELKMPGTALKTVLPMPGIV